MGMLCKRVIHGSLFEEKKRCNGWSPSHSPLLVTTYSNVFNNSPKQAQRLCWGLALSMTSAEHLPGGQALPWMHGITAWGYSQYKSVCGLKDRNNSNGKFHNVWPEHTVHSSTFPLKTSESASLGTWWSRWCHVHVHLANREKERGSDMNQCIYFHPLSHCTQELPISKRAGYW